MKKCPYCAEMIQDEAIKCRYCFSDLRAAPEEAIGQRPSSSVAAPGSDDAAASQPSATRADAVAPDAVSADAVTPTPAPAQPHEPSSGAISGSGALWGSGPVGSSTVGSPPGASSSTTTTPSPTPASGTASTASVSSGSATAVRYTHSGYRYVLGYGSDFFGIWDRQTPSDPAERFPRTDDGWRQAWLRFAGLEPNHVAVPADGAEPYGGSASMTGEGHAEQYTHSGTRYLLGYGTGFFGIWDRQDPSRPVERFPRTDEGWADAWRRYTQIESRFSEVSLGNSSGS